MFETQTHQIRVTVEPLYIPEKSNPEHEVYLFAYRIQIHNLREEPVQLMNRHWIITDAKGAVEEVQGPGVIGQQPVIAPNESFEYSSFCPLNTPTGSMVGEYEMRIKDGATLDVRIPLFQLVAYSHYN